LMIYRVRVLAEAIRRAVGPPRQAKSGHADAVS
jgi:hypothetical protein